MAVRIAPTLFDPGSSIQFTRPHAHVYRGRGCYNVTITNNTLSSFFQMWAVLVILGQRTSRSGSSETPFDETWLGSRNSLFLFYFF